LVVEVAAAAIEAALATTAAAAAIAAAEVPIWPFEFAPLLLVVPFMSEFSLINLLFKTTRIITAKITTIIIISAAADQAEKYIYI
jgi:hypothetical protein